MRERTGQINENKITGKWIARVCYQNKNGKRTAVQKTAETESDAKKTLKRLLEKLENGGREAIESEKLTFNNLADYYEKHYAKPPKYIDERKVEGLKDYKKVKSFLKQFKSFFGGMKLQKITYGDILEYRNCRLNIPTHYKKPRTIATMNREISYLRRIFNIAVRQNWILMNPVNCGESLIDISAERRRERILTLDEERRLLEACSGKRKHLKPLIICLLATGARKGETMKLRWSDIDFENHLITFQALNTKTLKSRKVAITSFLYDELVNLWNESDQNLNSFVFNFRCVRKAFESACKEASIETGRPFGITLHSLRHTVAVRLVKGNFPLQFTARILGHQSVNTTFRYLSVNDETLFQATSILESFHCQTENDSQNESDFVN